MVINSDCSPDVLPVMNSQNTPISKLIFGIDPDVEKSGLSAMYISGDECELLFVNSFGLFDLIAEIEKCIESYLKVSDVSVRIESAGKVSATFGAYPQFTKVRAHLKRVNPMSCEANAFASAVKSVEKKGRNAEVANQIVIQLEALEIKHAIISPSSRQRMDDDVTKLMTAEEIIEGVAAKIRSGKNVFLSKLDSARFNTVFDLDPNTKTNEDKRDSALLLLPDYVKHKYLK